MESRCFWNDAIDGFGVGGEWAFIFYRVFYHESPIVYINSLLDCMLLHCGQDLDSLFDACLLP